MFSKIINWDTCKIILAISLYCIIINYFILQYCLNIIESNLSSNTTADIQINSLSMVLKTSTQNDPHKNNVSDTYPVHYLNPWHPAELTTDVESDSPGEGGRPVILNDSQRIEMKKRYQKHQFNIVASEMISLNRSLLDFRPFKCRAKRYPTLLPATSIIIVFFNEAWSTILRTVWSVINRSPRSLVNEILLVDDGSNLDFLGKPLDDYVTKFPIETKVIRRKNRTGLVGARLLGVQYAKSKVVTFIDAHCECCDGWLEPLLARIVTNRNSIVSPYIDYISPYTFEHKSLNKLRWGGFDWSLSYKWDYIPQREYDRRKNDDSEPLKCPTIAGGIFSIDKDYFNEIGSYDEDTIYWGGENLEISFRVRHNNL